jgi:tetratricopeptide (TPR) repeat protein
LYQAAGDVRGEALALNNLGWTAGMQGEFQRAAACFSASLHLRERLGDERACAWTLSDLGWLAREAGAAQQAADYYHQAWQRYQTLGDRRGSALSASNLALATAELGDGAAAQRWLTSAASTLIELRDQRGLAYVLEVGAALALRADQPLRSAELLGAADALRTRSGAILPTSAQRWYTALCAAVQAAAPADSAAAWEAGRQRPLAEVIVGIVPAYLTLDLQ